MAVIMSRRNRGRTGEVLCNFCDACNRRVDPAARRRLRRRESQVVRRAIRDELAG